MACPTLRTTNDMPIVQPPTFEALDLVPFQINPHYLDAMPDTPHLGESRAECLEQCLEQFLERNDVPVVGLREGTWPRREGPRLTLGGITAGALLFRRGQAPEELAPGADLSDLLRERCRFDVSTTAAA
ncbi:hypothetical protein E1265_23145 [Streptomyces sp. 8K308]|nr:hypothetical protein E1265_23145 [Streptomyces sp. 8K308]